MAVFRIERTKDYTVMSNHHLRNHELSLKAKGLLSMMLSLPDDWNYKNLFLYTKMRNVAGLSTSDAQKSSDMFAKCRYMDELTGNRGVIFATGTPVSNSMTVRP